MPAQKHWNEMFNFTRLKTMTIVIITNKTICINISYKTQLIIIYVLSLLVNISLYEMFRIQNTIDLILLNP